MALEVEVAGGTKTGRTSWRGTHRAVEPGMQVLGNRRKRTRKRMRERMRLSVAVRRRWGWRRSEHRPRRGLRPDLEYVALGQRHLHNSVRIPAGVTVTASADLTLTVVGVALRRAGNDGERILGDSSVWLNRASGCSGAQWRSPISWHPHRPESTNGLVGQFPPGWS